MAGDARCGSLAVGFKLTCEHYWASHCYDGLSVRLCQLCHEPDWEDVRGQLAAAVAAERERLYDQLGHNHHVIFQDDGWTVEHSVECRLAGDMTNGCAYWTALKRAEVTSEPDPGMYGRWRIDLDSEGLPSLTRTDGGDVPS